MLIICAAGRGGCWLSVQLSRKDTGYLCNWVGWMLVVCAAGWGGCWLSL